MNLRQYLFPSIKDVPKGYAIVYNEFIGEYKVGHKYLDDNLEEWIDYDGRCGLKTLKETIRYIISFEERVQERKKERKRKKLEEEKYWADFDSEKNEWKTLL